MTPTIRQHDNEDEGFTLIELMVVVLIIAILLAIAIPTFLGAQSKAKDRDAQSSVRNALTSAKTLYADTGTYTSSTATALATVEPALTFTTGASAGPKTVSVATTATAWYGAARSASGVCYYIEDSTTTGTEYFKVELTGSATCVASSSVAYTKTGWDAAAPAPTTT